MMEFLINSTCKVQINWKNIFLACKQKYYAAVLRLQHINQTLIERHQNYSS